MTKLSQAKRQAAVLNDGFLDLLSENRQDFAVVDLDAISGTLADLAVRFVLLARANLEAANRIATGALAESIQPTEVEIFGSVYRVEIRLADYYKFVDEGVKGWQDERGGASPYQFKRTPPGKKMVTEIRKWVIREGLKGRGRENRRMVGRRDTRRNSITDTSTRTAYAISSSIKKKGLRPSHFWRDTVAQMRQDIETELGKSLKVDIINNLIK